MSLRIAIFLAFVAIFFANRNEAAAAPADRCTIVPSAFPDFKSLGLDEARISALTQLCTATIRVRSAGLLPRGSRLALRSIANSLIAGSTDLQAGASLDRELLRVLPGYTQQLYSDAQQRFKTLRQLQKDPNLTAALLRPACISKPSAQNCFDLPQDQEALQIAFENSQDKQAECRKNDDPKKDACKLRIDDAAISAAIASDVLLPFIRDQLAASQNLRDACKSGLDLFHCLQALLNAVERPADLFMEQSEFAHALQQFTSSGGPLSNLLPMGKTFLDRWGANVPLVLSNPATMTDTFFLAPDVQRWLESNAGSYQGALDQLRSTISAERFTVAKTARTYLDQIVAAAELQHSQVFDQTIKSWRETSQGLSENNPAEFIAKVFAAAPAIFVLEQPLAIAARHAAILVGTECKSSPYLDPTKGSFDVCFGDIGTGLGAAGFRFTFSPCLNTNVDCDTSGHVDLLLKVSKAANQDIHDLAPTSFGIVALNGTISIRNKTFLVRRPPAPTFTPDQKQIAQSAELLLPYPFQLKQEDEKIEVSDGPTISMRVRPTFSLPNMFPVESFRISIGPKGISVDGANEGTIRAAITKRIAAALQKQKVSIGGLELALTPEGLEKAGECNSPGTVAFTLTGTADLRPSISFQPAISVQIDCAGKSALIIEKTTAQRVIDEVVSKLSQAASRKISALGVTIDRTKLQFELGLLDGCSKTVTLDLGDSNFIKSAGEQIALGLATCEAIAASKQAAAAAAKQAVANLLSFAGLSLQSDGNRACTVDLPTIGRVCISPVKDIGKVPVGQLRVEDDGKFIASVKQQFGLTSPVVQALQLRDGPQLVLPIRMTIPGLDEPISAEIPLTGNMNLAEVTHRVIAAQINSKLGGKASKIGPIELADIGATGDAGGVTVTGKVRYGIVGAGVKIQILPSLKVSADPPDPKELALSIGLSLLDNPPVDIKMDPDGVPALHWPIRLNAALFGGATFEASTVVHARANGDVHLGSVGVMLPGWLTIGYFAIGRARIEIDLDHPENLGLGAALTIAPGPGTSEIIRVSAGMKHEAARKRITMEGDLAVLTIPLARTDGFWEYGRGVVDVTTGPAAAVIPLPHGRLVVDGPDCSIIGTASFDLLGARLTDVTAGFLIGSICNRGTPAVPEMAAKMANCGSRGGLGAICMNGNAQLANIARVDAHVASRLDAFHPVITAQFNAVGLTVRTNITASRVKLQSKIFNILNVTLAIPNLGGLDEHAIYQLFLNLLKPNIDLEALLSGKFTINPFSPAGKGDGDSQSNQSGDGDEDGDSDNGGDDLGDGPSTGNPPSKTADTPTPSQNGNGTVTQAPTTWIKPPPNATPGTYLGPPGPCQRAPKQVDATHYRVMVTCPGGAPQDEHGLLFRAEDASNLASGRLVLQSYEQIQLDDGSLWHLACDGWPCKSNSIVALSVGDQSITTALKAPAKITLPIGDIYQGPEVAAEKLPFVALANLLARRQLSGAAVDLTKLKLVCIRRSAGSCLRLAVNINNAGASSGWSIVSNLPLSKMMTLAEDSFANRLLSLKCPPEKSCAADTSAELEKWDGIRIRASGRAQQNGLPRSIAAEISPADKRPTELLMTLAEDGTVKQQIPMEYQHPRGRSVYEFSIPTCIRDKPNCTISRVSADATVALLDDIAGASAPIRLVGHGTYAAAITGQADSEIMYSALMTQINSSSSVCSRHAKWSDIRGRLTQNQDPKSPLYRADIEPNSQLSKKLLDNSGDQALLQDLTNPPPLTKDGYHRDPLQLFPSPDLARDCAQVTMQ